VGVINFCFNDIAQGIHFSHNRLFNIASALTAACKTVGLLQDFSLEPEMGNTRLDLVVVVGCIGLGSEGRGEKIAVRPPISTVIGYRLESRSKVHPGVPNGGRMEQIHR